MGKLKVQKNTNVIAFDFCADLLAFDRLYNICCIFNLKEVYMDIYSAYNQKSDLNKIIVDSKLVSRIFCVRRKYLQDIHIKLTVDSLSMIMQLLAGFNIEGLNISDCYNSWENHVEDIKKPIPYLTIKPIKVQSGGKFYLYYLPDEGHKVTIICDMKYDNQDIQSQLIMYI